MKCQLSFCIHYFSAKVKREEYVAAITTETNALETVKELLRTASEMFVVRLINFVIKWVDCGSNFIAFYYATANALYDMLLLWAMSTSDNCY